MGESLLTHAVKQFVESKISIDVVLQILQHKDCLAYVTNQDNESPLYLASKLKLVSFKGATKTQGQTLALKVLIENLFKREANINQRCGPESVETALTAAVKANNESMVAAMLHHASPKPTLDSRCV